MVSGPITSWQMEGWIKWKQWQVSFSGLQDYCGWSLQPWNEKTLAPWKESYDKPRQHIKKQRHTLLTKVCIVKAMVFPIVMYGCESWTIKKAVVVQSLSQVWLFATPWTVACQVSLSLTISQSLPKLMSIESVMPSKHLIPCHPLLLCLQSFPASGSFLMDRLFASGGQSIAASTSVFLMNIQSWFLLGLTGLISLLSKGLSRVFSSTTVQKHQFFGSQPSL